MVLVQMRLQDRVHAHIYSPDERDQAGIILATGVYMILEHSVGIPGRDQVNVTAVLMTLFLAAVYYGARKVLKNGISPIGLIVISAVAGIVVYGIV